MAEKEEGFVRGCGMKLISYWNFVGNGSKGFKKKDIFECFYKISNTYGINNIDQPSILSAGFQGSHTLQMASYPF